MSTDPIRYLEIDVDGTETPRVATIPHGTDYREIPVGRYIVVTEAEIEAGQRKLRADYNPRDIWAWNEAHELVHLGQNDEGHSVETIKADSIAFIDGDLLAVWTQNGAEIALGLTAEGFRNDLGLDDEEELGIYTALRTVDFRVADHEDAFATLSASELQFHYDASDPTLFHVYANGYAGDPEAIVQDLTALLPSDGRLAIIFSRIHETDAAQNEERLVVRELGSRGEEITLEALARQLLTLPWNPTTTEVLGYDRQIAQGRGDILPPTDAEIDAVMFGLSENVEAYAKHYGLPQTEEWRAHYRQKLRRLFGVETP